MLRTALFFSLVLCLACSSLERDNESVVLNENDYAEGFSLAKFDNRTEISVLKAWKGGNFKFDYIITQSNQSDLELENPTIISGEIESVICLSTTHIAFLDALGLTDKIVGVTNGDWVFNKSIQKGLAEGRIVDLGNDTQLDYERIIELDADIILSYAVDESFMTSFKRLQELKQKVVVVAEYMESAPLGQSEWLRFYGALFLKQERADSIFRGIELSYLETSRKAKLNTAVRPTVFCNLPWKEVWYVPGGKSFTARLIADAGGDYVWKENDSRGSIHLDFESVFMMASVADIWINPGNMSTLEQIRSSDPKLARFKAFRNAKVYNAVRRMTDGGGNDFYESASLNCHKVLEDLVLIFSGDSLSDAYYYKKLK